MDGVFELGEGGVFDVQIGLRPMPVELEEMVVEAESGPMSFLERNGFYDRVIGRGGVFMIREDIDRLAVDKVTDVFRQIPLLDTDESRPLTGGPDVFRNPEIRVIRNGQYCSPTLYIDRHMVDSGSLGGGVGRTITLPQWKSMPSRSIHVPVRPQSDSTKSTTAA